MFGLVSMPGIRLQKPNSVDSVAPSRKPGSSFGSLGAAGNGGLGAGAGSGGAGTDSGG